MLLFVQRWAKNRDLYVWAFLYLFGLDWSFVQGFIFIVGFYIFGGRFHFIWWQRLHLFFQILVLILGSLFFSHLMSFSFIYQIKAQESPDDKSDLLYIFLLIFLFHSREITKLFSIMLGFLFLRTFCCRWHHGNLRNILGLRIITAIHVTSTHRFIMLLIFSLLLKTEFLLQKNSP